MRVLLISHTCQSRTEGQPRARALSRIAGLELRVVVPDRWKHYGRWRGADAIIGRASFTLKIEKVRWPWTGPGQFFLHWYPSLRAEIQDFKPDIIDLWEEPWGLVSAQAACLRGRYSEQTRIVCETEQNIDKRLPPPFEQFRSYTLARTDFAIGRSDEAVAVLRNKGYSGPATSIPNAVDAEVFRPMNKAACRRELSLTGFIVGYVGRLVPEKGIEDLVDAVASCPGDVSLLIAGEGPLREALAQRMAAAGRASQLRFLGAVAPEKLPTLMNAIDVLALPSRTTPRWKEQFGRVLIEANACGTPVIGSNSGAIPQVVGAGGLIVCERSPAELARAIRTFADNPGTCREMGEAGRNRVMSWCTWERVAEQIHEVYSQTLSTPSKSITRRLPKQSHALARCYPLSAGRE